RVRRIERRHFSRGIHAPRWHDVPKWPRCAKVAALCRVGALLGIARPARAPSRLPTPAPARSPPLLAVVRPPVPVRRAPQNGWAAMPFFGNENVHTPSQIGTSASAGEER